MTAPFSRRRFLLATGAGGALAAASRLPAATPPAGPDPAGPARLMANENPFGPGPAARRALVKAAGDAWQYPMRGLGALRAAIAELEGVTPDHVVLGTGSGEILCMAAAYGAAGGEIVSADPTFEQLGRYAEQNGATVLRVPLDGGMRHDLPAMARAVTNRTGLVYVCNPNNPTGTLVPTDELRDFCIRIAPAAPVFVDEAYVELMEDRAQATVVDLVREGHNVIVARTFSKLHGLAGLRIGYGLARPDLAVSLARYRMTMQNGPGLAAAVASLADLEFQAESRRRILVERGRLETAFDRLGLEHAPSAANFVFVRTGLPARAFQAAMREQGVLVGRPFPPYDDWCRISVGLPEHVGRCIEAIEAVLAA